VAQSISRAGGGAVTGRSSKGLTQAAVLLTCLMAATTWLPSTPAESVATSVSLPPPREFCTQGFEISITRISPPDIDFGIDYEFDQINYRAEWRKGSTLRVADLYPDTGLPVGTVVVVDTGIVTEWPAIGTFPFGGNGAEWAYSARGSELFYMKPSGFRGRERQLVKAYETSPGQWATEALPGGALRGFPIGSKDESDSVPRILFTKHAFLKHATVLAIREVPEDPDTEWTIRAPVTVGEGGPRWVPGRRQIVLSLLDESGVEQVAIYDLDTRDFDMVTHYTAEDDIDVDEPWVSELPSLGPDEITVWFVVNNSELRFYRKDETGSWVMVNAVNPSEAIGNPAMPYILSPEPCTFQGESYIVFQSSVTKSREMQPGDIYLMMPGSSTSCQFRLLTPADGKVRKAPECLELTSTLAVYFVEWDASGRSGLYKAETGLP